MTKAQQRQNNEKHFREMIIKKMYMHYVPSDTYVKKEIGGETKKIKASKDGILGFTREIEEN